MINPMILYRPVGLEELRLIYEAQMAAFPPRLEEQPIFYPVLNFEYAAQIAKDWNTKSRPYAGYVTEFDVDDSYVSQFEIQTVGNRTHQELWVPAEELDTFNENIIGQIRVTAVFFGTQFEGHIPQQHGLRLRNAVDQFIGLNKVLALSPPDFHAEIKANHTTIYLNFPFWEQYHFSLEEISSSEKMSTLHAIQQTWQENKMPIPLITLYILFSLCPFNDTLQIYKLRQNV